MTNKNSLALTAQSGYVSGLPTASLASVPASLTATSTEAAAHFNQVFWNVRNKHVVTYLSANTADAAAKYGLLITEANELTAATISNCFLFIMIQGQIRPATVWEYNAWVALNATKNTSTHKVWLQNIYHLLQAATPATGLNTNIGYPLAINGATIGGGNPANIPLKVGDFIFQDAANKSGIVTGIGADSTTASTFWVRF